MPDVFEIIIQFLEKNERYPSADELAKLAQISVENAQNILDEYMDSFDDDDDDFVDTDTDGASADDIRALLDMIGASDKK